MFSRSLQMLKQPTKSLKIKLTNKQTPCLTLEIEQVNKTELNKFNKTFVTKGCRRNYPEQTISS